MKITFYGLETVLHCKCGQVTTFEVESNPLFGNICISLLSGLRDQAVEPYMLWNDSDEQLKSADNPIIIASPLELPWNNRAISGGLYQRVERALLEDDAMRLAVEKLGEQLSASILGMTLCLEGNYAFGLEWGVSKYLKAFGFAPDVYDAGRLIDNLENFLAVVADIALTQTLVFINLKKFLDGNEYDRFVQDVKIFNISVLLLESMSKDSSNSSEFKHGIDQRFLEY